MANNKNQFSTTSLCLADAQEYARWAISQFAKMENCGAQQAEIEHFRPVIAMLSEAERDEDQEKIMAAVREIYEDRENRFQYAVMVMNSLSLV